MCVLYEKIKFIDVRTHSGVSDDQLPTDGASADTNRATTA